MKCLHSEVTYTYVKIRYLLFSGSFEVWSLKVSVDHLIYIFISSSSGYYLCMKYAVGASYVIILMCYTVLTEWPVTRMANREYYASHNRSANGRQCNKMDRKVTYETFSAYFKYMSDGAGKWSLKKWTKWMDLQITMMFICVQNDLLNLIVSLHRKIFFHVGC
jgi:hypothetical protein